MSQNRGGGGALFYDDTGDGTQGGKVQADIIAQMLAVDPLEMQITAQEYQKGYAANDRGLKYQIEGAYAVPRAFVP